jgi:hypothetical protein
MKVARLEEDVALPERAFEDEALLVSRMLVFQAPGHPVRA